ncbi:MAG: protein kinase [Acidobacteriota bacterium]
MVGKTLSHYRVIEKLGEGGMGEVYRAEDTTLKRQVALKVLRSDLASGRERLRRFQNEAETLASLDHPNIVHIYTVEEAEGARFLTMQLVEGTQLRELIPSGGMDIGELFAIAVPMAEGLAAAHEKGIIHRDLKPGNVMVTSRGGVKILDFGLAKLRSFPADADEMELPTQTLTGDGKVLGTVPYMAPEQVRGGDADLRTDIFALGIVLYEMASGVRPFRGKTTADLALSILGEDPPELVALRPGLPEKLSRIVSRCLEKEPARRYQTMLELRTELADLQETTLGSRGSVPGEDPGIDSLAVLPFAALSGSEEEYFADGVTEALITDLAKLGAFKVISRTSVMRYRGSDLPLPEIARELGVRAVVEGSIARSEGRIRVSAQLIEAAEDRHLWAESYERDLRDVLELQRKLAEAIAGEVQLALSPEESAHVAARRTVDPRAHDLYLQARHEFHRVVPVGVRQSIRLLHRAIEISPDFADAYVALAESHGWQAAMGLGAPRVFTPLSTSAALKALSLDGTIAKARALVGFSAFVYDWDPVTAERELRRAVEMGPQDPTIRAYLGIFLCGVGQEEEGLEHFRHALGLDPHSAMIHGQLAFTLYLLRRIDDAIDQAHESLRIDPSILAPHIILALSYRRRDQLRQSLNEWKKVLVLQGAKRMASAVERVSERSGYETAVGFVANRLVLVCRLTRLLKFLPASRRPFVSSMSAAVLLAEAGENDRCITWLYRAAAEKDPLVAGIKLFPHWDNLRGDPRFEELVERVEI